MKKALLLVHSSANPYYNMAVDEYLFGRVLADPELIFLRLYSWAPGGITFGLNQKLERALDFDQVGDTPVIRRITGGRALYHDPAEITYSITMGLTHPNGEVASVSASEVSHSIAIAWVAALSEFGIKSQYARNSSQVDKNPLKKQAEPCFSSHARHEIVTEAGKLVASAQRVIGHAFFQHGSLKPHGIISHPALPNLPENKQEGLGTHHFKNSELAPLGNSIAQQLGTELGVDFAPAKLKKQEQMTINELTQTVKKKNLDQREIIKQPGPESSLLK